MVTMTSTLHVLLKVSLPPIPVNVMEQEAFPCNFNIFHYNGIIHLYDCFRNQISIL